MTTINTKENYSKYAEIYESSGPQSFYHKYIEKPGMYSLLPDLKGKNVLCIGVGSGDEANYISKLGAKVVGIDISEGLLNIAKKKYPKIQFKNMDMEKLNFPKENFDFVYSSLTLHYSDNLLKLFKKIYSVLKRGGNLQFSITHPVLDSAECYEEGGHRYRVIGSKKDLRTGKSVPIGDYFGNKKMKISFSDEFVVEFNHYTISEWINSVINAGFQITKVLEPIAIKESKLIDEAKYNLYNKKPLQLIVVAKKE